MDLSKAKVSGILEIEIEGNTYTMEIVGVQTSSGTSNDFVLHERFNDRKKPPTGDQALASSAVLRRVYSAVNTLLDLGLKYEAMASTVNNDKRYQASKYTGKVTPNGLSAACRAKNRQPQVTWDEKRGGFQVTGIHSVGRGDLVADILEDLVKKIAG